jgi:hypothetical protein
MSRSDLAARFAGRFYFAIDAAAVIATSDSRA